MVGSKIAKEIGIFLGISPKTGQIARLWQTGGSSAESFERIWGQINMELWDYDLDQLTVDMLILEQEELAEFERKLSNAMKDKEAELDPNGMKRLDQILQFVRVIRQDRSVNPQPLVSQSGGEISQGITHYSQRKRPFFEINPASDVTRHIN